MDRFLGKCHLLILNEKDAEKLRRLITCKELAILIKKLLKNKVQDQKILQVNVFKHSEKIYYH